MSLLITGSTGFLGNGLLHLLEHKKYNKKIYLTIRNKNNKKAIDRFNELKQTFSSLHLILIEHDLLKISELSFYVEHIIHCAASIHFCLELQEAIIQNVDNVIELIKFAKNNSIKNFVHISTAYVCEHGRIAKRKFTNLKVLGDVKQLYSNIKSNEITFTEILTKKFFPNTYCFTKCLAEKMIELEIKNNSNIHFSIIRPSIITNARLIPYPGWFKGYSGTIGVHKLIHSKMLNYIVCNKNIIQDYIPVDLVSSKIYNSIKKKQKIIQFSTSYLQISIKDGLSTIYRYNPSFQFIYSYDLTYYISKYYKLLQIICCIIYYYVLSLYDIKYKHKMNKMIKLLDMINNIQSIFHHILHNTYYFPTPKKQFDKNYYKIMNEHIYNH